MTLTYGRLFLCLEVSGLADELKPFVMKMSWNNEAEGWAFPVMPDKIEIRRAGSGKDYDIIKTGKVQTIEQPELREVSFESFFPTSWGPFVSLDQSELLQPSQYVSDIERWWKTLYPIRFVYIGKDTDERSQFSLPMSITSFETWEEAGSPGDVFFSLRLKEYVFYKAKRITAVRKNENTVLITSSQRQRADERVPNTTYTLKPGDTLIKVARIELGDSSRWTEIQSLNKITDSEIRRLQVGRVLQLPAKKG